MTRVIRSAAVLAAFLAMAVPGAAQDALNTRVSLDLKAMAPRDAFKVIADAIGYTADVAPDVSTPIDILVRNITAKTALNTICESIGCTWQAKGTVIGVSSGGFRAPVSGVASAARPVDRKYVVARRAGVDELQRRMNLALPADMRFENVPMAQVAERLSKATGFEITFSGDASPGQTFSADLGNRPFSAALTAISQQLNGNLICRITMHDSAGNQTPTVSIQIGGTSRKPRK
jgi:hypothetical protein